ncbi:unnamed protein product [Ilex paraguariensis]|uniref:Protein kinase domain-containing protein n=1 Tax=Ilex paraguariensis TaxID=185542 RepID=A0ABC8T7M0_9AQUA
MKFKDQFLAVSCTKTKKKKNNVAVPVVASIVAALFVVLTVLGTLCLVKRRRQRVRKVDADSNKNDSTIETKNRQFTYSEVLSVTNNFERAIGKGGFGTVYHGYVGDTQVAVKMLSPQSIQGYKQFQAEANLLMKIHHKSLTSFVGYCNEGTNKGIIYEYMANGNLEKHLSARNSNVLNWEDRLQIAIDTAQGLEYLHYGCKPPIIHRDVKCTNILLDEKFHAKLADFRLSRAFPIEGDTHVSTVVAGTPGYLDPDIDGQQGNNTNNTITCQAVSCTKTKKKKNNVVVPVVASIVAALFVVLTVLGTLCLVKRRRQRVRKVDADSNKNDSTIETKNRQFTYSEVLSVTNNFERAIGKGGFGTVYHGYVGDTQVAVKMLSPQSIQGYKQFQAEANLLMKIHHKSLTSFVGYCNEGTNKGIIYEYMANGNLEKHLSARNSNVLNWEDRLQIAIDTAQGLEYLHDGCKPPIIHRDVKCTNILLDEKFHAKLADFGLSRACPIEGDTHVSTVVAGTPGYLDPEYYSSNRLTDKSDVYSFGVVLLEIITGQPAIIKTHEQAHIVQWVSSILEKGDVKNIVDPRLGGGFYVNSAWKAVELAMACVSRSSNKRPTMTSVVKELKECLDIETADNERESKDSIGVIPTNMESGLGPRARSWSS